MLRTTLKLACGSRALPILDRNKKTNSHARVAPDCKRACKLYAMLIFVRMQIASRCPIALLNVIRLLSGRGSAIERRLLRELFVQLHVALSIAAMLRCSAATRGGGKRVGAQRCERTARPLRVRASSVIRQTQMCVAFSMGANHRRRIYLITFA